MKPIKIDLEELVHRIGWTEKHADYLLITQNTIVIVEETSRAKTDDIKKLNKIVEALIHGPLKDHLPIHCNPSKIIAIVHVQRRVDPMISKIIGSRTRKSIVYRTAKCRQDLGIILHEHKVQL